jgi:hypothetical protein
LRLVALYRGVLLYSDSGVGKSSLINAGLIPAALDDGYRPYVVKLQPKAGEELLLHAIELEASSPAGEIKSSDDKRSVALGAGQVADWLVNIHATRDPNEIAIVPLLIFDQFEEAITLFENDDVSRPARSSAEKQAQACLFETIVSLVNAELPRVRLLFSFREDFLAKLSPLFSKCPGLLSQYFRLEPLKVNQVIRLVRGPFDSFPGAFEPEISLEVAESISQQFAARSGDGVIVSTEVQIVCQTLSEKMAGKMDQRLTFNELGGVSGMLQDYFLRSINELGPIHTEPAIGLLSRMLTRTGSRNIVSRDDLLTYVEQEDGFSREPLLAALDALERKTGLIHRERRRDVYFYEITSEFLIEPIRDAAEYYLSWRKQRPFGHLVDLVTGETYFLAGNHALIGRGNVGELGTAVNFATRFVSRIHLLVLRSHEIFDARSTNGTTLNGLELQPGELKKMVDGDIIVVADNVALRFRTGSEPANDTLSRPAVIGGTSRGLLIDGAARSATPVAAGTSYLSVDPKAGWHMSGSKESDSVFCLMASDAGDITVELLRDNTETTVTWRERGNIGYRSRVMLPGQELPAAGLHFLSENRHFQILELIDGDDDDAPPKEE